MFFFIFFCCCCCCCSSPFLSAADDDVHSLFYFIFFVHLYYFFSFRRHISATGSGYVLFIDVFAEVPFVFSSTPPPPSPPPPPIDPPTRSFTRARRRIQQISRICTLKELSCAKKIIQLGRAWSPGIPPTFFSSYHFQQVTNQVLCRCHAVHGSYIILYTYIQ